MSSNSKFYLLVLIALVHLLTLPAYGDSSNATHFYLEANEDDTDLRADWYFKVVHLALEKTRSEYGPYDIHTLPHMSFSRQWKILINNQYRNFLQFGVYTDNNKAHEKIAIIHFPVQLGLLGYRVCFHAATPKPHIPMAIAKGNFKSLTYGQGAGWSDVSILRYNGYKVLEIYPFDSLFKMNAAGRFDLFCRGVSEIYDEFHLRGHSEGLVVEELFAFHYPYPVFMHLNKANKLAIKRLTEGLYKAHEDGSLQELFQQHYRKRLDFVNLPQRKIISLENPLIETLDPAYKKYLYEFQ